MKLFGTLCMLLLLLPVRNLLANGAEKLFASCDRTFIQRDLEGYSDVRGYIHKSVHDKDTAMLVKNMDQLEIIYRQKDLEREKELMYRRIIFASIFWLLVISLLLLLYTRQRQKVRLVQLAQAGSEKERQFLTLQKETEHRLTRKFIDGLESERERMATELHDDVCNSLLAFEMNVRSLTPDDDMEMEKQLELLKGIRERLRNMSHELMPPVFQHATIDEMLADYVLHLSLPEPMRAVYNSTEGVDWKKIPQDIGFEFYRIVQEAVSNALKHAGVACTCIQVELSLKEKCLSVLVADDGKGFELNRKIKGVGLHTMWQRANIIGGKMELETAPGEGVCIRVSVWI